MIGTLQCAAFFHQFECHELDDFCILQYRAAIGFGSKAGVVEYIGNVGAG